MSRGLLERGSGGGPEHWRPVDRLLARWVQSHAGSAALARWAGACSAAEGEGHTALALDDAARFGADPTTRSALDDPRWVGDGQMPTPFVREGEARLYLWRYWQAERRVAAALAARATATGAAAATPSAALLDELFGGPGDGRDIAQREAVRRCAEAPLFVLTGGPGTGKTSTVLRMLLARLQTHGRPLRVQVAAPTGKAAQRLVQALRDGFTALAGRLAGQADWAATLAGFPRPEALTVHRLLGFQPTRQRHAREAGNPIAADLVIIDEASMLDLEQLDALLDALPATTALWLVGDADQLNPVGPGSAFQDLVQALANRVGTPMVRLVHGFRADAALDALNQALRAGDRSAVASAFAAGGTALRHVPLTEARALDAAQRDWALALAAESRFAPLPADPVAAGQAAALALAESRTRQWLCATREGAFGSLAANARFDTLLRQAARSDAQSGGHYPGRRLLITRNDPDSGLFNGDVGLCLADAEGRLRAWFETAEGPRALPLALLPPHEPAFALTVHKSQGSEYAHVAVLLPPDPAHRLLSRELLYTAASRARRSLVLYATAEVLTAALAQPVRRSGGLHVRLDAALGPAALTWPPDRPR